MKFKKGDVEFDGKHFTFLPGIYQELKKEFSDKDVDTEIRKAEKWLLFNPPKKIWTRFLCNWLNNAPLKRRAPMNETPQYSREKRTATEPTHIGNALRKFKV